MKQKLNRITINNTFIIIILVAGWFIWSLLTALGWLMKSKGENIDYMLKYKSTELITGILTFILLIFILKYIQKSFKISLFISLSLIITYLFAMIWETIFNIVMWQTGWFDRNYLSFKGVIIGACFDFLILFSFSLVYFFIIYWQELQLQKEKTFKATALANEAQLQMLRYQLNPHFLFNALNSIRAMIRKDISQARHMVTELSEFLRYSLINGKEKETTIEDEIKAINNYLDIQKIRFGDQLQIETDIDSSAQKYNIPCFLIHPLIENGIKYGMKTSSMPLKLKIQVAHEDKDLVITVSNSGKLIHSVDSKQKNNSKSSTGTGIKNIIQRLNLVFPNRYSFNITEKDGWVYSQIRINKEDNDEKI